ncbi:MAG: hypothetical protein GF417_09955 [Candidatus Latescibacteria bacterium]|nr:hypothetical protein [bacterium]MBD3424750.1 hypothetical protein [Candidatus Latescibacterota bacterium]
MHSELNLSMNDDNEQGACRKWLYILLALTVIIASATLVTVVMLQVPGRGAGSGGSGTRLEELALKLEKRGLDLEAADTWREYLQVSRPGREQSGRVWYRIGKIYQDNTRYSEALAAYYRAESYGPLEGIENEISGRITECLEMMGRFNALESELAERTSIRDDDEEDEVVAEIGNRKITDTEVKQLIEDEVDNAIGGAAPGLTGDSRNRQKEMMLENAMKPGNRNQWLSNYIAEELIYREAIGDQLHRDPEYRRICEKQERALLVQRYLNLLYSDRIDIDEQMLRDYYQANQDQFTGNDGEPLSFQESIQQVYARVRMREENRVQQKLMEELRQKHDVVVHSSRLPGQADSLSAGPAE